jgi:ankyrin repeat protein
MNQIHTQFALRNLHAFQRLLDCSVGQGLSSSAEIGGSDGKSLNNRSSSFSSSCDVNDRDWLGRTVLHIACAFTDPSVIEYIRLLLTHPAINVNLPDVENHWTALYRALYPGNIPAAYSKISVFWHVFSLTSQRDHILLLQRSSKKSRISHPVSSLTESPVSSVILW